MPKRSAAAMMKVIPSTSSQQQQPEKRTRQSSTAKTRYMSRRRMINYLPTEILDIILNLFETHEQCKLRLVCRKWKNCVEKIFALTRCLKLNLIYSSANCKMKTHTRKWEPALSMQSLQFDSNWIEPTMELRKKVYATVQEHHFNEHSAHVLSSLFSKVHYLVIYFDLCEEQENFANFIHMIKGFKMLESFSLIRKRNLCDRLFIPNLCETLEELSPLRRFDLYVKPCRHISTYHGSPPQVNVSMMKLLPCVEHFALSGWSHAIRHNQYTILQNISTLLNKARKVIKSKPLELASLCISMNPYKLEKRLNIAQVFGNNAELHSIKRLQLTNVDSIDEVASALELCPKLQSLELYMDEYYAGQKEIKTNAYIEMINKCQHLSEVKIFNGCLSPFKEGTNAPQIRKLTIAGNSLFDCFTGMLRKDRINIVEELDEVQIPMGGMHASGWLTFNIVANEFVRMITLKFPALEQLTVLTDEDAKSSYANSRASWLNLKSMIINKLGAKSDKLKIINIEMFHVIYQYYLFN